jgi:hypothetical protein
MSQISGVRSVNSTGRQDHDHSDSSPILAESAVEPETPSNPLTLAVDCGQAEYDQNPEKPLFQRRHTNEQPLSFLDRQQNGWLWEILGLVVCVLSFGAVVGFISVYSGKPIPHFAYGITVSQYKCLNIRLA